MARTSWSSTPFDRLRISIFGEYSSRPAVSTAERLGWAGLDLLFCLIRSAALGCPRSWSFVLGSQPVTARFYSPALKGQVHESLTMLWRVMMKEQ